MSVTAQTAAQVHPRAVVAQIRDADHLPGADHLLHAVAHHHTAGVIPALGPTGDVTHLKFAICVLLHQNDKKQKSVRLHL